MKVEKAIYKFYGEIIMSDFTWLDDRVVYNFFRECEAEIPRVRHRIGCLREYRISPELCGFEERKKRFTSLSYIYGDLYSQRLLYSHLALDRFLRLKMPINRLSTLLNELFLFFERYLYMKLKWEKGGPDFYRDHSLHAANEAYLGYMILSMMNENKDKFIEEKFLDYFKRDTDISRYLSDYCRVRHSEGRIKQIIYRAWFIASLFHDVGYVLSFNKESREYMIKFHRHSDLIYRANRSSFDDIQLLLGNSLLFNTVEHKNIEDCYNFNKHGVMSALLLLATFYSPPAFDNIEPLDRAAIELAAEAIYHHDEPEDNKIELKLPDKRRDKKKPGKPFCSGKWSVYFKKDSNLPDRNKIEELLLNKNLLFDGAYKIDFSPLQNKDSKSQEPKRIPFKHSPFAYYLRFIDELHVFGRSKFSIEKNPGNGYPVKESPFSFPMPFVRNVVQFPAQLIKLTEGRKLNVYFVADASLYNKKRDNMDNESYDKGHNRLDESGIGFFLKELFWLKMGEKDSKLFEDLDFYFIEGWPKGTPVKERTTPGP